MKVVEFKSFEKYYEKERNGIKPHTERVVDPKDERFKSLKKEGEVERIVIRETYLNGDYTGHWFIRVVTDYYELNNNCSISWKPEPEIMMTPVPTTKRVFM